MREVAGVSVPGSQPETGTDAGHRPARIRSPAGSTADGEAVFGSLHEKTWRPAALRNPRLPIEAAFACAIAPFSLHPILILAEHN
jgi:hypothetical protein